MTAAITLEEWKEIATKKHGGAYEYSFTSWKGLRKGKVKIYCKQCEDYFDKDPASHIHAKRGGCQICERAKRGTASRSTTDDFVKKADRLHNGIYDYSKAVYVKSNQKVTITCKKHGDFQQTPNIHLRPAGCKKCAIEKQVERQRLSNNEFIEASRKIHADKYDYSRVVYVNAHVKVEIKCSKHGWFWQTPAHHKNQGNGCNLCGYETQAKRQSLTLEQFVKKANQKHLEKYDYSKVKYVNFHTKVKIICPIHGQFEQTPANHIHKNPRGCSACGDIRIGLELMMPADEYFKRVAKKHLNKFDYSKSVFRGTHEKIKIICPEHGEFLQLANAHLKYGCNDCGLDAAAKKTRSNTAEFIFKAEKKHNKKYDYSLVDYQTNSDEVEIICPVHGIFPQTPAHHLNGTGCPNCYFKAEGRILKLLESVTEVEQQYRIADKRFDFYLPEYDLLIERDGQQHYYAVSVFAQGDENYLERQRANDALKTKLAKSSGFRIARLPFWLTEKEEKREIRNLLNGAPSYPNVPDIRQLKTRPAPR